MPHGPLVEHGEDVGKTENREKVAQAGTCLCHMEFQDAQIDDVALQEDRDREQPQKPDTQFRRDQLQRCGHFVIQRVRQRQHIDQMQDRRPEMAACFPAEADKQDAAHPQDQRIGHDIGDIGQPPDGPEEHRDDDDDNADPAVVHSTEIGGVFLELAQKQQPGQHGNQRAVAVFRQAPRLEQCPDPVFEEHASRTGCEYQPEHTPCEILAKVLKEF